VRPIMVQVDPNMCSAAPLGRVPSTEEGSRDMASEPLHSEVPLMDSASTASSRGARSPAGGAAESRNGASGGARSTKSASAGCGGVTAVSATHRAEPWKGLRPRHQGESRWRTAALHCLSPPRQPSTLPGETAARDPTPPNTRPHEAAEPARLAFFGEGAVSPMEG
jgi:hypothetical protein